MYVYVPSILDSASSIYARNLRSILNLMLTKDENDGTRILGTSTIFINLGTTVQAASAVYDGHVSGRTLVPR